MDVGKSKEAEFTALLAFARQKINEGQPTVALQAIITVLRAHGGDAAVHSALMRARAVHEGGRQADDLASILAQCQIGGGDSKAATGLLADPDLASAHRDNAPGHVQAATEGSTEAAAGHSELWKSGQVDPMPILAEHGRFQIVVDASEDGSSFTCASCGGVVSLQRRDEHLQYWCPLADTAGPLAGVRTTRS